MFKHALTQDVAYASLLVQRRRELHRLDRARHRGALRRRLAEHYEVLAHHFSRAEDGSGRCDYLLKAAEKAAAGVRPPGGARPLRARRSPSAGRLGDRVPAATLHDHPRRGRTSSSAWASTRRSRRRPRTRWRSPGASGDRAAGGQRADPECAGRSSGWRTSRRRSRGRRRRSRSPRPPAISSAAGRRRYTSAGSSTRSAGNPDGGGARDRARALAISRSIGDLGRQGAGPSRRCQPRAGRGGTGRAWTLAERGSSARAASIG